MNFALDSAFFAFVAVFFLGWGLLVLSNPLLGKNPLLLLQHYPLACSPSLDNSVLPS